MEESELIGFVIVRGSESGGESVEALQGPSPMLHEVESM